MSSFDNQIPVFFLLDEKGLFDYSLGNDSMLINRSAFYFQINGKGRKSGIINLLINHGSMKQVVKIDSEKIM